MPGIKPKTKTQDIAAELVNALNENIKPSQFELKKFEKSINEIPEQEDRITCMALLEVLKGNIEQALIYFERGYSAFGALDRIAMNHVKTIERHISLYDASLKAFFYSEQAETVDMLISAMVMANNVGAIEQFKGLYSDAKRLVQNDDELIKTITKLSVDNENIEKSFDDILINQDEFQAALKTISELLKSKNIPYNRHRSLSCENEFIGIHVPVNLSLEEIIDLNEELIDLLIDNDISKKIIPQFTTDSNFKNENFQSV